jgi:tape measure domain-containing protein
VAYRADIEIAVKGAQELKRLQDQVSATSKLVEGLNNYLENIGSGGVVRSIQNLRNVVSSAASALGEAAIGTKEATIAAEQYVKATSNLNAGLREQSNLIEKITRQERAAALVRIGVGAPAQQLLLPAARPGAPAMSGGARRRVTGAVERLGGARSGDEAATTLRFAQGFKEQVRPLSQIQALYAGIAGEALKLQTIKALPDTQMLNATARGLQTIESIEGRRLQTAQRRGQKLQQIQDYYGDTGMGNAGTGFQGPAIPPGGVQRRTRAGTRTNAGFGRAASGALSNAAVGGAFPLLFGQSGSAAAGGAIGGALGSAIPGIGGFGGSLIGTILGEKLGQANQVKQLGEDIGFSAEQTKMLGTAFQQAGRDFDKFQQSVSTIQGLSLSIEDQARAIQLASSLTETYKGKIDKVTTAFASALSTGKVTQGTLNQLTNQGIPIQQALADKYNVSRSAIIEMAKDGKISVQDLIDTLVKVGNEGAKAADKQKDVFADSFEQISKAVADFQTTASQAFKETADALRVDLGEAVQAVTTYITDLIGGFAELARVAGPVLDPIISGYINLEKAIFNAVGAVPALRDAVVQFALQVAGPLAGVVTLMNQIRNAGKAAKGPEKMGPYVPDRLKEKPQESFIAPSQAAPSGGKKDNSAEKAAKAAEREAARVANIVRDQAAITQQKQLQGQYSQALFAAELAKDEVLKIQLQREREIGEISLQYSKQINDEKAKGNSAAVKEAFTKTALVDVQLVELKTAQQLAELQIKTTETYTNIISDLDYQLQLKTAVTEQDRIQLQLAYEAAKLRKDNPMLTQEQIDNITKKKADLAAPKTDAQNIAGRVGQLQDEIKEMTKLSTIAITSAEGIGNAFANSFKSLIDGSMSAREALSAFFQDVASMFLEMAAQIIAKQLAMIVLQSILKALGAVAGASGGGGFGAGGNAFNANGAVAAGTGNIPSLGSSYGFAKGGAFANGITAFAAGGIVGSPTLFKFANGGTTQTGLMGEAGPEAIMPLSRGAGGKLGVNASGLREAMGGAPGMGGLPVLSMSFETTRFGDTDYVSRDQLEAAMAQTRKQASADGAKRGMSMTLDRLQQSPQTRNRVGLR